MGYNGTKQKRLWGTLFDRGVGADNPEEKSRYYRRGLRTKFHIVLRLYSLPKRLRRLQCEILWAD